MVNKCELVKKYIMDAIENRIYIEGQLIESEAQLCKRLDVSRPTVRHALNDLENEGIVYKEKGRGTFVQKQTKYAGFQCGVGFTYELEKRGLHPSTKEASIELIDANQSIAQHLNIPVGTKVWEIHRVRCANNQPILYANEFFLYAYCPDLNQNIVENSIFKHLDSKDISFAFMDQEIKAISSTGEISQKLNVHDNHPLIKMTITSYMKNGIPFSYAIEYYKTDEFNLIQSVYNKNL